MLRLVAALGLVVVAPSLAQGTPTFSAPGGFQVVSPSGSRGTLVPPPSLPPGPAPGTDLIQRTGRSARWLGQLRGRQRSTLQRSQRARAAFTSRRQPVGAAARERLQQLRLQRGRLLTADGFVELSPQTSDPQQTAEDAQLARQLRAAALQRRSEDDERRGPVVLGGDRAGRRAPPPRRASSQRERRGPVVIGGR